MNTTTDSITRFRFVREFGLVPALASIVGVGLLVYETVLIALFFGG